MTKEQYKKYLEAVDVVCMECCMDTEDDCTCESCPVRITCDTLTLDFDDKLNMILNKLDERNFSINEYKEHGKLCGYEMETWTVNGVNMIHFIDCRNYPDRVTAENVMCQLREINAEFNVDNEIHKLMYDKAAREAFTYRDAVHDMEAYEKWLRETVCEIQEAFDNW